MAMYGRYDDLSAGSQRAVCANTFHDRLSHSARNLCVGTAVLHRMSIEAKVPTFCAC